MKSKLGMTLFFGVFFAAGAGFFVFATLPMLSSWHSAKNWHETPAQLISHKLKTSQGDDSTTYQVIAEYRYQIAGVSYTNGRVAVNGGSDNIGSFHQDLARKLRKVADTGGNFHVWVNPDQPTESLIDRSLRIPLLLLYSVFVIVFGGIGAGGMVYTLKRAKKHEPLPDVDPSTPWLSKHYWASPEKISNAKSSTMALGFFALIWNLISLAPLMLAIEELNNSNSFAYIALIFPAIGLGLIYFWLKLKSNFKSTGAMPLSFDPYPGAIGGHLGGTIKLANRNPSELLTSGVVATCVATSKSGKNTRTNVLWQNSMVPAAQATASGTNISFCFDIPADLPESESSDRMPHKTWKLSLNLSFQDGFKIKREYVDLPVFKTGKESRFLKEQAFVGDSAATIQAVNEAVDKIIDVQKNSDGYRLYYPAGRQKWGLGLSLFGLLFVGIGLVIPDLIFNIIFPAIGGLFAILGFYFFANSLNVRLGAEGITSTRKIFGVTISTRFVPSFSFKEFRKKRTHSTSTGSSHTQYYSIIAHGQGNEKAVVVENLKGDGQAQAAIEKLIKLQSY